MSRTRQATRPEQDEAGQARTVSLCKPTQCDLVPMRLRLQGAKKQKSVDLCHKSGTGRGGGGGGVGTGTCMCYPFWPRHCCLPQSSKLAINLSILAGETMPRRGCSSASSAPCCCCSWACCCCCCFKFVHSFCLPAEPLFAAAAQFELNSIFCTPSQPLFKVATFATATAATATATGLCPSRSQPAAIRRYERPAATRPASIPAPRCDPLLLNCFAFAVISAVVCLWPDFFRLSCETQQQK